jgi:hypothetical protein
VRLPVLLAVLTPRLALLVVEDDDGDGKIGSDAFAASTDPFDFVLSLTQRSAQVAVEQHVPLDVVEDQHIRSLHDAGVNHLIVERPEDVDVSAERTGPPRFAKASQLAGQYQRFVGQSGGEHLI